MSDPQFDDYRKLLAIWRANPSTLAMRPAMEKAGIKVYETDPISGYYRLAQTKGGPLEPVAIWRDTEGLCIQWGHEEARLEKVWTFCVWKPVPYEWYCDKLDGKEWPDVHQLVEDELPLDGIEEMIGRGGDGRAVVMGDNSGEVDEALILEGRIDEKKRGVKQYILVDKGETKILITTDEQRDQSQTLRSDLLALSREADTKREALVRPHIDAQREINGKWNPLVKAAKEAADAINKAQSAYETVKLRRQREENERIEAERLRLEQEGAAAAEAAQAAVDAGEAPPDPVPMAPPPEPVRVAPTTSFKGGTGRAASTKPVTVITDVTDWKALFLYFVEDQDARAYVLKRAQSILKNTGEIPPGCATDVVAKVA